MCDSGLRPVSGSGLGLACDSELGPECDSGLPSDVSLISGRGYKQLIYQRQPEDSLYVSSTGGVIPKPFKYGVLCDYSLVNFK